MPEPQTSWLKIATSPSVVKRALLFALVVGPILCAINHFDVILTRQMDALCILKMTLTFLVPYCVSTFSSVSAISKLKNSKE